MDRNDLNWRGVVIFALAVLTVIVLIRVIDDEPASLGVNTAQSSSENGATTTTAAGGATSTTKPSESTDAFDPAGKPNLETGASGADVIFLQQQLARVGYYTGAIDGAFGNGTASAVRAFQADNGITPADGVVNQATWSALAAA